MKLKYIISISLIVMILSCSTKKSGKDFLDFYIGMNEKQFNQVKDSLLNVGTIYEHQGEYYYDFKIENEIVPSLLFCEIDNGELKEITINLGRKANGEKPRINEKSSFWNDYFTECILPQNAELVYQIYRKKYGKPDEFNSAGRYPCWKKSNHVDVRFSRGYKNDYTCDSARYFMGAFINYSYDSDYKRKRDFKKTQDNI